MNLGSEWAVCIPARIESDRVHHKLLRKIDGKPVIRHAYDRVKEFYGPATRVYVVTDSKEIAEAVGCPEEILYIRSQCKNGSQRIAKAVSAYPDSFAGVKYIINVQGDNSKLDDSVLSDITDIPAGSALHTLGTPLDPTDLKNTKLVSSDNGRIMFAHRGVIGCPNEYDHVGIYSYTKDALLTYKDILEEESSPIQDHYDYEMLGFMEHGLKCTVKISNYQHKSINFEEDLTSSETEVVKDLISIGSIC